MFASATPIGISYDFTMGAGSANTAPWFVIGQFHNNDQSLEALPRPHLRLTFARLSAA
jgi:hypothetical protein